MGRSRLVPLAAAVTLLVAVVALVARGRPLGSGGVGGGGLPLSFWDYVYTTIVIVTVPLLLAVGIASLLVRGAQRRPPSLRSYIIRTTLMFVVLLLLEWLVLRHLKLAHIHLRRPAQPPPGGGPGQTPHDRARSGAARSLQFRWTELVVILGLLLVLVAIVMARSRRRPGRPLVLSPEVLAAALDESLDDLRADPDLRRAIVAAYARMEAALAAAGIPRDPAEAPLEYVERALLTLDTSAESVRRLTDLFEWARFSQHEPEPSMRDDAVDALIAVRDELRASELTPA
jgi:Domain of unknown function (DUF4129)